MGTTGWHLNPSPRARPEQGDWGAHAHVPRGCMGTTQPVAGIPCAAVGELPSPADTPGKVTSAKAGEPNTTALFLESRQLSRSCPTAAHSHSCPGRALGCCGAGTGE